MFQRKKIFHSANLRISDIIPDNPYLLLFFEHFGITLPVKNKTIQEICDENKLNSELVIWFANLFNGITELSEPQFSLEDTKAIIQYLKNSHEFYSHEIYPEILDTIEQLAKINHSSEMELVKKFFAEYFDEVTEHLDYENNVVFPYVIDLYERIKNGRLKKQIKEYSVVEYREHHNDIEEKLEDLKKLLIKYLPEKNDQIIRRKLLFSLFELEYDLNVHSQIEEHILIPLVEQLETRTNQTI
jgi:regulator of cell morphogenesis and NO signaling